MAILKPKVNLQILPAAQILGITEGRVLIVGQKLLTGTAPSGILIQDVPDDGSEDGWFGIRSQLAAMVRRYKLVNRVTPLDVIPLDDPTGTNATGLITITGTAAEIDGVYTVSIVSKTDHKYIVDVLKDDTPTEIAVKLVAAIAQDTTCPFTSVESSPGVVTCTAVHEGTIGNAWGIKIEGVIPGLTVTAGQWSGGTGSPTLTGILDQVENIRYQTVVWPESFLPDEIETHLNAKFNAPNKILDGVAVQTKVDTLANLKTYINTINSQSFLVFVQRLVTRVPAKGGSAFEMPDKISADFAAVRSLRRAAGANLTEILATVAPQDQFGSTSAATLPYFNTLMPYMPVAAAEDEFNADENEELENSGGATAGPNPSYTAAILGAVVTTYTTDSSGNPDDSYKYLNTVDAASVVREFFWLNCRVRYGQSRLTPGDLIPGYSMANLGSIRAYCKRLYRELADNLITVAGAAALRDFDENLVLTPDYSAGTVTLNMAPLLVTQFRALVGTIQIKFLQ